MFMPKDTAAVQVADTATNIEMEFRDDDFEIDTHQQNRLKNTAGPEAINSEENLMMKNLILLCISGCMYYIVFATLISTFQQLLENNFITSQNETSKYFMYFMLRHFWLFVPIRH